MRGFASLCASVLTASLLTGCGGNGAASLSENEVSLRSSAPNLAEPAPRGGWVSGLTSSIVNFDMPWSSSEDGSSNAYINRMFSRRFDSQEARYNAIVDDAVRADGALEAFAVSAREVAREDEERLAGLIGMVAAGSATEEDIGATMRRVQTNRLAVEEGLIEAQSWEQTFREVRDRAHMELPNSDQAAHLDSRVGNMARWVEELTHISDRMATSNERVAAEFGSRRN